MRVAEVFGLPALVVVQEQRSVEVFVGRDLDSGFPSLYEVGSPVSG